MISLGFLLILAALIALLFHISTGKPPLWFTVLMLVLVHLLGLSVGIWPR